MARIDVVSPQGVSHGTPPQANSSKEKPVNGRVDQLRAVFGGISRSSILRWAVLVAVIKDAAGAMPLGAGSVVGQPGTRRSGMNASACQQLLPKPECAFVPPEHDCLAGESPGPIEFLDYVQTFLELLIQVGVINATDVPVLRFNCSLPSELSLFDYKRIAGSFAAGDKKPGWRSLDPGCLKRSYKRTASSSNVFDSVEITSRIQDYAKTTSIFTIDDSTLIQNLGELGANITGLLIALVDLVANGPIDNRCDMMMRRKAESIVPIDQVSSEEFVQELPPQDQVALFETINYMAHMPTVVDGKVTAFALRINGDSFTLRPIFKDLSDDSFDLPDITSSDYFSNLKAQLVSLIDSIGLKFLLETLFLYSGNTVKNMHLDELKFVDDSGDVPLLSRLPVVLQPTAQSRSVAIDELGKLVTYLDGQQFFNDSFITSFVNESKDASLDEVSLKQNAVIRLLRSILCDTDSDSSVVDHPSLDPSTILNVVNHFFKNLLRGDLEDVFPVDTTSSSDEDPNSISIEVKPLFQGFWDRLAKAMNANIGLEFITMGLVGAVAYNRGFNLLLGSDSRKAQAELVHALLNRGIGAKFCRPNTGGDLLIAASAPGGKYFDSSDHRVKANFGQNAIFYRPVLANVFFVTSSIPNVSEDLLLAMAQGKACYFSVDDNQALHNFAEVNPSEFTVNLTGIDGISVQDFEPLPETFSEIPEFLIKVGASGLDKTEKETIITAIFECMVRSPEFQSAFYPNGNPQTFLFVVPNKVVFKTSDEMVVVSETKIEKDFFEISDSGRVNSQCSAESAKLSPEYSVGSVRPLFFENCNNVPNLIKKLGKLELTKDDETGNQLDKAKSLMKAYLEGTDNNTGSLLAQFITEAAVAVCLDLPFRTVGPYFCPSVQVPNSTFWNVSCDHGSIFNKTEDEWKKMSSTFLSNGTTLELGIVGNWFNSTLTVSDRISDEFPITWQSCAFVIMVFLLQIRSYFYAQTSVEKQQSGKQEGDMHGIVEQFLEGTFDRKAIETLSSEWYTMDRAFRFIGAVPLFLILGSTLIVESIKSINDSDSEVDNNSSATYGGLAIVVLLYLGLVYSFKNPDCSIKRRRVFQNAMAVADKHADPPLRKTFTARQQPTAPAQHPLPPALPPIAAEGGIVAGRDAAGDGHDGVTGADYAGQGVRGGGGTRDDGQRSDAASDVGGVGGIFGPLERSDKPRGEAPSSPPPLSDSGGPSKSGAGQNTFFENPITPLDHQAQARVISQKPLSIGGAELGGAELVAGGKTIGAGQPFTIDSPEVSQHPRVLGLQQESSSDYSDDPNAAGAPHSPAGRSTAVRLGGSQPDFPTPSHGADGPYPYFLPGNRRHQPQDQSRAAARAHRGTSPGGVELKTMDPSPGAAGGDGLYALGNPVPLEGTDQLRSTMMMMEVGNSLNVEGGLLQARPRRIVGRQIIVPGGEM